MLHIFLYIYFPILEPRTEIVGEKELYVDYASSLNITCLIRSPNPPAYVFWKKEGKDGEQLQDLGVSSEKNIGVVHQHRSITRRSAS